jgi:hypothetical protein
MARRDAGRKNGALPDELAALGTGVEREIC